MQSYLFAIRTAMFLFPFLALLITLPYIIFNYYRYGSVLFMRSLIIYSFILYLLNAFFLVILPLPSFDYVESLTTPRYQIVPFQFISDIVSTIKIEDLSSLINFFTSQVFLQVLFNTIMTIPFGFYLRYYFKVNLLKVIIITFILSLFFEITQLTGLYGIYPRNYRLFDVDDLFLNTLGGIIGYLIVPLFHKILPSREKIDQLSYYKGRQISFFRRFMAFMLDTLCVIILMSILPFNFEINYILIVFLYYFGLTTFLKGKTIGKLLVSIKIVKIDDTMSKWYQYLIRYILLYIVLIPLPYYLEVLINNINNYTTLHKTIVAIEIIFMAIIWLIFIFEIFLTIFDGDKILLYDKIGKTKLINVAKKEENKLSLENTEVNSETET